MAASHSNHSGNLSQMVAARSDKKPCASLASKARKPGCTRPAESQPWLGHFCPGCNLEHPDGRFSQGFSSACRPGIPSCCSATAERAHALQLLPTAHALSPPSRGVQGVCHVVPIRHRADQPLVLFKKPLYIPHWARYLKLPWCSPEGDSFHFWVSGSRCRYSEEILAAPFPKRW